MAEESGGHFYKRNGEPCHAVPKADGKGERSINLRWDRPLGLVPSVTSVLSILDKPALTSWKVNQAILASLTAARREGEGDEEFCKRVREEAFEEVEVAKDKGSLVHDAIEQHFKGQDVDPQWMPYVQGVLTELNNIYPDIRDWVAERSFAHPMGFGGRVDLYSPSMGIVVDFKGKDGDFLDKKKLHYDQYIQLAGYQIGLELPLGDGANIFFSRTHPGIATSIVWDHKKIEKGRKIFLSTLETWKAIKDYDSSFKKKESSIKWDF